MKKRCVIDGRWVLAALVMMLGLAVRPPPAAATHINCGDSLGPGGTYTLDSDILLCAAHPVLTVESATLNLDGHTVSGVGAFDQHCIQVEGTGSVIRGTGTVQSCHRGVVVAGGGQHVVRDVLSELHTNNGFLLQSNDNRLTNNISRDNTFVGISVGTSQSNLLTGNTATSNGILGFEIVGTSHHLVNNTATENGDTGFLILGDDNKIQDNFAADNAMKGIEVLVGATDNRLMGNVGESNSVFDLVDDNPNCDQNRWRGNTGTRNQNCIR